MEAGPTVRNASWRYLLRDLTNRTRYRVLANLAASDLELALTMPAAIARWIEKFAPHLKKQDHLHIIIAGAEWGPDCVDEGRWYQMVPALLGNKDMSVKVTLVGPNCNISTRPGAPAVLHRVSISSSATKEWVPAAKFVGTLGAFVATQGLDDVSMVLLSHPGLEMNAGLWLARGELDTVLAAGVPTGTASYALPEFEQESWIADLHGYTVNPAFDRNPFALAEKGSPLPSATAAILAQLQNTVPGPEFRADPEREVYLQEYDSWMKALQVERRYLVSDREKGTPIDVPGLGDVFAVPPGLCVHKPTGEVYEEQNDGSLHRVVGVTLPAELLAAYPANPRLGFDRALWVMQVSRYLEGMQ